MRKIKKEKQKVEVEKEVIISDVTYCDVCGKEVSGEHWSIRQLGRETKAKSKDVCSKKCIDSELNEYLTKSKGGAAFYIIHMPSKEKRDEKN